MMLSNTKETASNQIEQLFPSFSPDSSVWVYQSNRALSDLESEGLEVISKQFANNWQVHGQPAIAEAVVLFNYFLIFVVDAKTPASGCSIDASVGFVKQVEQQFGLNFFDRMQIVYESKAGDLQMDHFSRVKEQVKAKELAAEAKFFDNTITTLAQLKTNWFRLIEGSWLG